MPGELSQSANDDGERLSPLLDDVYAAVVAGTDSEIAAATALAIARVQGQRRRVAIADLVGETRALEALLGGDDAHGVSDSFLYGVSLNKIARPINDTGTIFLMPSGTESVANEGVYANERWRRLAAGFHQVGALLLIVAVPGTPGFSELCGFVGAIMPVGKATFPVPPGVRLIAPPPAPAHEPPAITPPSRSTTARARAVAAEDQASRRNKLFAVLLGLAAIGVAIGASWQQLKPYLPAPVVQLFETSQATPADSASVAATPAQRVDTLSDAAKQVARDSAALVAALQREPLQVANPGDSVGALRYSIYFSSANNRDAATPDAYVASLPAMATTVVHEDGLLWYRVTVGAYPTRAAAAARLVQLQSRKVVSSGGSILTVPYAIRLDSSVAPASVPTLLADYNKRGIAAYSLRMPGGRATVVTGAFETPTQANILADSLEKIGIAPVLVYRTGRMY
ncbi:MAG TPA: SPOR domain-containing protein [Gemmatimonas sp.]|nr:SPOR domain-containing protein [Gemmatimonas sp.]